MTTDPIEVAPAEVGPSWVRLAGYAGIAYVVLFFVLGASIAAGAPVFTDGAEELRTWFSDHQGPVALFTWLGPLTSGPLYLFFAAGLRSRLASVDPSGGMLTRVSYSGAVAGFAFSIVGLGFWGVMTLDPVLESASDGVLVTLSALDSVVFFVIAPWAQALFVVAASVVMLLTRTMPVWLGALGCLAGLLFVIGGLWIFSGDPTSALANFGGFGGGFGAMLWVLIASVFLIREGHVGRDEDRRDARS